MLDRSNVAPDYSPFNCRPKERNILGRGKISPDHLSPEGWWDCELLS
jgi:hypothetical protein